MKVWVWKQLSLLTVGFVGCAEMARSQTPNEHRPTAHRSQIVFVCEHGAALSVVAAAYFNKLARERHVNLHAVARGTTPQEDIAVSARAGLVSDGVAFETKRPQSLSRSDAKHALRIVAFVPLPSRYAKSPPVETWNDVPPTSANYGRARDIIVQHIEELLIGLQHETGKELSPN